MQNICSKITLGILFCVALTACAGRAPAPVVDLQSTTGVSKSETNRTLYNHSSELSHTRSSSDFSIDSTTSGFHTVKPGETLFSIAWRYSLDFNELADINNIKANRIYPGQKLSLQSSKEIFSSESLLAAISKEVLHKRIKSKNTAIVTSQHSSNSRQSRNEKQVNKRSIKASSIASSSGSALNKSRYTRKNTQRTVTTPTSNSVKRWIWPVNGKIINHFSDRLNSNKGVDISAKHGSPVRAAANGKVVYSGRGLRGYGRLVIIKHNDAFLSAYAHNDKLHVEQNEFVKAGQRIADLGSSDSDKDKLHFEIRYKGKPVDPLNYLPKSGIL